MVLGIHFHLHSNANIKFAELEKLIRRSYTIAEVLHTISWMEVINKKEFVNTTLDENSETFAMYIVALKTILIHLL